MKKFILIVLLTAPPAVFAQSGRPVVSSSPTAAAVTPVAPRPVVPSSPAASAVTPVAPRPDSVETGKIDGTNLNITTDDNWSINITVKDPTEDESKYVILLPDLGKNKSSYAKLAKSLGDYGIGYVAVDLRGHGKSAFPLHYSKFAKTGIDNQFNKMYKDANAAVNYLKNKGVKPQNIFILGSGLGANVAANSIVFNNDIGGAALISPTSNTRDVLSIPGVKVSKMPLLIAAAPDNKKLFLEASLIRNIAFLQQGTGRITFLTAYDKDGTDMIDAYLIPNIIAWVKVPAFPGVKEDGGGLITGAETPPANGVDNLPL